MDKDRWLGEGMLQIHETLPGFLTKMVRACLPSIFHTRQHVCQPTSHMRISMDKPSVEVCKAQEYLNFMKGFWFWPFSNASDPLRIFTDTVRTNNESQKLDFLDIKFAFAKFGIKLMLP